MNKVEMKKIMELALAGKENNTVSEYDLILNYLKEITQNSKIADTSSFKKFKSIANKITKNNIKRKYRSNIQGVWEWDNKTWITDMYRIIGYNKVGIEGIPKINDNLTSIKVDSILMKESDLKSIEIPKLKYLEFQLKEHKKLKKINKDKNVCLSNKGILELKFNSKTKFINIEYIVDAVKILGEDVQWKHLEDEKQPIQATSKDGHVVFIVPIIIPK